MTGSGTPGSAGPAAGTSGAPAAGTSGAGGSAGVGQAGASGAAGGGGAGMSGQAGSGGSLAGSGGSLAGSGGSLAGNGGSVGTGGSLAGTGGASGKGGDTGGMAGSGGAPTTFTCGATTVGGPWPMRGRCPHRRGVAVTGATITGVKWTFGAGGPWASFSPVVIDASGAIYTVGCKNMAPKPTRTLLVLSAAGALLWSLPLGEASWCYPDAPAIGVDGTLYIVVGTALRAISSSGVPIWSTDVGPGGGDVAIGDDGTIYANGAAVSPAGTLKWKIGSYGSPAITDDGKTIYFASGSSVSAVRTDGTVAWTKDVDGGQGQGGCGSGHALGDPTAATDGTVYLPYSTWCPDYGAGAVAVTAAGEIAPWHVSLGKNSPVPRPTIGLDGWVHLGKSSCAPTSVCAGLWMVGQSPAIAPDGTLYFGLSVQKPDGTQSWSLGGNAPHANAEPAIGADGTVVVPCDDGQIYALGP